MATVKQSLIAFLIFSLIMGTGWPLGLQGAGTASAQSPLANPSGGSFSSSQIEQLVAPIALYPDSLLAQVLMAATYPLDIVQAARWLKSNPGIKGNQLDAVLEQRTWDASVKSLVYFPDVLNRMNDNLDWTQDLGDAFLAQQQDVMNAVQKLRSRAQASGNLKSTQQTKVLVEKEYITIEPPAPDVVYVPVYDPTVVYGPGWYYPSWYYPTMMVPPPGYVAAAGLISFGIGVAVGAAMFGGCNWWGHNVYINNNIYVNNRIYNNNRRVYDNRPVPGGKGGQTPWRHDPDHRGNVPYNNAALDKKYGRQTGPAGDSRDFRGFDKQNVDRQSNRQNLDRQFNRQDADRMSNRQDAGRQGGRDFRGDTGQPGGRTGPDRPGPDRQYNRQDMDRRTSGDSGRDPRAMGGQTRPDGFDRGGQSMRPSGFNQPGRDFSGSGAGRSNAFSGFNSGPVEHSYGQRGESSRSGGGFGGGGGGFGGGHGGFGGGGHRR